MQVAPSTTHSKNPQLAHTKGTERHKDPTFPRRRRRRQQHQHQQRGVNGAGFTEPAPNPRQIAARSNPDRAALGRRATLGVEAPQAATFFFSPPTSNRRHGGRRIRAGAKRVMLGFSLLPGGCRGGVSWPRLRDPLMSPV